MNAKCFELTKYGFIRHTLTRFCFDLHFLFVCVQMRPWICAVRTSGTSICIRWISPRHFSIHALRGWKRPVDLELHSHVRIRVRASSCHFADRAIDTVRFHWWRFTCSAFIAHSHACCAAYRQRPVSIAFALCCSFGQEESKPAAAASKFAVYLCSSLHMTIDFCGIITLPNNHLDLLTSTF